MRIALESFKYGTCLEVWDSGFSGRIWLDDFECGSEREFLEKVTDLLQEAKDNMANKVERTRQSVQEIDANAKG